MDTARRGVLVGAAAALSLLGPARSLMAAPLDKVRELGVLRVGLYRDNRPWSWEEGSRAAGIDADLARAIADVLGVKTDLAFFTADENVSDDLRNVIWRGGLLGFRPCDLMMHAPFDMRFAAKEERAVFIAPYAREEFSAICSPQTKDCDMPPQRFVGNKVGAELDSIPDFYLMGSFGGILRSDVVHFTTGYEAAAAVQDGAVEMAVASRAEIEAALFDRPDAQAKRRKSPLPMMMSNGWDIGIAVRDDSRSLGAAIEDIVADMAEDGRLSAIFARYGVTWQPATATQVAA
jgi:polar amino acid transport system substrate-binding protein